MPSETIGKSVVGGMASTGLKWMRTSVRKDSSAAPQHPANTHRNRLGLQPLLQPHTDSTKACLTSRPPLMLEFRADARLRPRGRSIRLAPGSTDCAAGPTPLGGGQS